VVAKCSISCHSELSITTSKFFENFTREPVDFAMLKTDAEFVEYLEQLSRIPQL
jgi:hypothetical protein